eukprot:CAMPEP_0198120360 /NCGR_PEP_ID=MMETSP1442-20131203/28782_1 /TAXON_ID= /ORGANISM="Craspedostauros australis, Strain CCMP3328" /LENGTH=219 /DNA_ID=CAMNT_0043779003 /DNA_START=53 /DNA_END=712 /DNA_ORIENTATION=-
MSLLPTKTKDAVDALGLIPHPEGGFFLETFRSGSVPMTSRGHTNFDVEVPSKDLVETDRKTRPDGDTRRNALTSIYWVPTIESPMLKIVVQVSDHVRLYHGGQPFRHLLYDPSTKTIEEKVLGPDVQNGHQLQISVKGGTWVCGRLHDHAILNEYEYCILAEVFGLGFDVCDFKWVTQEMVSSCSNEVQEKLQEFVNTDVEVVQTSEQTREDFDKYYND